MTRDELLAFVRAHPLAAVSTVSPSREPQVAVVRFVVTDAFELVIDTTETTRKATNLRENGKIAFAIGWDENQTIQIQGLADEPLGQELQRLKNVYSSFHPDYCRRREAVDGLIYFRTRPTWIRYSDYRRNPADVLTLDFVTGKQSRTAVPFRGND
jgi:hypothetical protein